MSSMSSMSSVRSVISWTAAPLRPVHIRIQGFLDWAEAPQDAHSGGFAPGATNRLTSFSAGQTNVLAQCNIMQHASNARNQQTFNGTRAKLEVTYLVDSLFMLFPSQSSFAGTSHNPVFFYGLRDRDSAVSFSHKAMGLCHASYNSTQCYIMILDQFSNALWVCQGWQMQVLRLLGRPECGWPHPTVKTQQVTVSRQN